MKYLLCPQCVPGICLMQGSRDRARRQQARKHTRESLEVNLGSTRDQRGGSRPSHFSDEELSQHLTSGVSGGLGKGRGGSGLGQGASQPYDGLPVLQIIYKDGSNMKIIYRDGSNTGRHCTGPLFSGFWLCGSYLTLRVDDNYSQAGGWLSPFSSSPTRSQGGRRS